MNLYLVKTDVGIYATNCNSKSGVYLKFGETYPDYEIKSVIQVAVEEFVNMEDNDNIIFF